MSLEKDIDDEKLEDILYKLIDKRLFETYYIYGNNDKRQLIEKAILQKVATKYVKENYSKLIKHLDIDAISKMSNIYVARSFSKEIN